MAASTTPGRREYGDQQMHDANLALLRHREDARRVRLFDGAGGKVTYVGELKLDPDEPYYETEAPETGNGPLRRVFVFNLHLLNGERRGPRSRLDHALTGGTVEGRAR